MSTSGERFSGWGRVKGLGMQGLLASDETPVRSQAGWLLGVTVPEAQGQPASCWHLLTGQGSRFTSPTPQGPLLIVHLGDSLEELPRNPQLELSSESLGPPSVWRRPAEQNKPPSSGADCLVGREVKPLPLQGRKSLLVVVMMITM